MLSLTTNSKDGMKARIIVTKTTDPMYREEVALSEGIITIGRLQENVLHLADPKRAVSKRHARIERAEDDFHIVDLKSVNRTFLNGVPLEPGKPYALKDGDSLRIADFVLHFHPLIERPVAAPEVSTSPEAGGADKDAQAAEELCPDSLDQGISLSQPSVAPQPTPFGSEATQRMERLLDLLLASLMRLMKAKEHFRQEFLGTTMVQNRNLVPLLSENVREAKAFFLEADASSQVVAEREAALSQAANDVQMHLVAFLEGYRRSVDEGTKKFLQQTDPAVLRERLGKLIWKVGPFEISYKSLPIFFQIKLIEMCSDRHRELGSEDRGVLETRYFRPGFIRAYEACMTAAKGVRTAKGGTKPKTTQTR
jgi:predicted component of type VI protein secretion system